ncbi:MAG: hypothetical protein ACYC61_13435 [Isosphaeraceae bacterium]
MGKPTSRKRRTQGRRGIGRVMAAVALAAVGLAMTRGMNPMHLGAFGPLVAILLWLFYTGVVEGRRLEGFHYATAVVTVLASGFLARQIALDAFRPLGWLASGSHGVALVGHLIGAAMSLGLGLAAGMAVRKLEQARGWDLAPFFRGAIVGSFLAVPIVFTFLNQDSMTNPNSGDRWTALGIIAAGFAFGGIVETIRA